MHLYEHTSIYAHALAYVLTLHTANAHANTELYARHAGVIPKLNALLSFKFLPGLVTQTMAIHEV
jgi:hypothetical protein